MLSIPVGSILGLYVIFLSVTNIVVAIYSGAYSQNPYVVILFAFLTLLIAGTFFSLEPARWTPKITSFEMIAWKITCLITALILLSLYILQGYPQLIDFRTQNQHQMGFLWLTMNLVLLSSPLANTGKSIFFTILMALAILLLGSRLYLAIFLLLTMLVYGVRLVSFRAIFCVIFMLILMSLLASKRDSLDSSINRDQLIFFSLELLNRNVALSNGIKLLEMENSESLQPENPLMSIVPRRFWPDKPLVYNVRAFMEYYGKSHPPAKSSGFFLSEQIHYYGFLNGSLNLVLLTILHCLIIKIIYTYSRAPVRLLLFPILMLGCLGPIDGVFSSSWQALLGILTLWIVYLALDIDHVLSLKRRI